MSSDSLSEASEGDQQLSDIDGLIEELRPGSSREDRYNESVRSGLATIEQLERRAQSGGSEAAKIVHALLDMHLSQHPVLRLRAFQAILSILAAAQMSPDEEWGRLGNVLQARIRGRQEVRKIENIAPAYWSGLWKFLERSLKQDSEGDELRTILEWYDRFDWSLLRQLPPRIAQVLETNPGAAKRREAAEWLGEKAELIAQDQEDVLVDDTLYRRVADALVRAKNTDDSQLIRDKAKESLEKIRRHLKKHFKDLKKSIQSPESTEDEVTRAIRQLAYVNTHGSREALEFLVKQWIHWLYCRELHYVEVATEAIRYNRFAVLPLVDHLINKTWRKTGDLPRCQDGSGAGKGLARTGLTGVDLNGGETEKDKFDRVCRRIARQLADMSDAKFFEEQPDLHAEILAHLRKHAVPAVARQLLIEEDIEILEDMARMLGQTSQGTGNNREAIDALARAVIGKERTHNARRRLLNEYYLKPSKHRSEQAASILDHAVKESKRTLRILQFVNVLVFVLGLVVILVALLVAMTSEAAAARVAAGLAAAGGIAGVAYHLVRRPLDAIQNAMSNLVQMQTAFTSFIWELNLNGTFIQSRYVDQGILDDASIDVTAGRIERAMEMTMDLVSTYTETGAQRLVTRLNKLEPAAGQPGIAVTIHGQQLLGDALGKKAQGGLVAIDHRPISAERIRNWDQHEVEIVLPDDLYQQQVWISLFVDGFESNALPFQIVGKQVPRGPLDGESRNTVPALDLTERSK